MDEQLLVIGGNAAGLAAALAARRRSPRLRVLVLEATADVSWGACGLPYNLADPGRDPEDLRVRPLEELRARGVEVALRHRVVEVQMSSGRCVVERPGGAGTEHVRLPFDRLVVASGAHPRGLVLPGLPSSRLYALKSLEDLRRWKSAPPGAVLVAGGGFLGVELAEALRRLGKDVWLVEAGAGLLAGWPAALRDAARAELEANGVRVLLETRLLRAREVAGGVEIELQTAGRVWPLLVERVADATGIVPAVDFLPAAWPRTPEGALVVDLAQRVAGQPVWAAGDCACRPMAVPAMGHEPERIWNPQAREALNGGRVAGWNAAAGDADQALPGAVATRVLGCFSLELARCGRWTDAPLPTTATPREPTGLLGAGGLAPGTARPESAVRHSHAAGRTRGHAMPDSGRLDAWLESDSRGSLRGGAILSEGPGAAGRINVLAALLASGASARELAQLDLAYSPPFGPLADPLLRAAEKLPSR